MHKLNVILNVCPKTLQQSSVNVIFRHCVTNLKISSSTRRNVHTTFAFRRPPWPMEEIPHHRPTRVPSDILAEREQLVRCRVDGQLLLDIQKQKRAPFIKNLFAANFDTDMLAFPEILSVAQIEQLNNVLKIEGYFEGCWETEPDISALARVGYFGSIVPSSLGGLSYSTTETASLMQAMAKISSSDNVFYMFAHYYSLQILLAAMRTQSSLVARDDTSGDGVESLCQRLIRQMSTGQLHAVVCASELHASSDVNSLRSLLTDISDHTQQLSAQRTAPGDDLSVTGDGVTLSLDNEEHRFLLNGNKIAVLSAHKADVFLVVVNVPPLLDFDFRRGLALVVVDKNHPNITVSGTSSNSDIYNDVSYLSDVEFRNVPVSRNQVISGPNRAMDDLLHALSHSRTMFAASMSGWLRSLVDKVLVHCVSRDTLGRRFVDFQLIKIRLARLSLWIYILESVAFSTAGVIDIAENLDFDCEAAACKLITNQALSYITDECISLLGPLANCSNSELGYEARLYSSVAKYFQRHLGSTDAIKLYIALEGLQFSIPTHRDEVKRKRDVFSNPSVIFDMFSIWPTHSTYNVAEFLHPSLNNVSTSISKCMQLISTFVKSALEHYGNDIMNEQTTLIRLSETVVDLFMLVCVASRASRSYCLGLRNCEQDLQLTRSLCFRVENDIQAKFALLHKFASQDQERQMTDLGHFACANSHLKHFYAQPSSPLSRPY